MSAFPTPTRAATAAWRSPSARPPSCSAPPPATGWAATGATPRRPARRPPATERARRRGTARSTTAPRSPAVRRRYEDVSIRFDLLSLRRSGNLATLRFTATNTTPGTSDDTDKEWSIFSDLASGPSEYSVNGVYLVDPAHSKRYPTATDSADDCVCSQTSGVDIVPTQSREFSATFAAPPADVATVDVYVPGAGTIENVPVS